MARMMCQLVSWLLGASGNLTPSLCWSICSPHCELSIAQQWSTAVLSSQSNLQGHSLFAYLVSIDRVSSQTCSVAYYVATSTRVAYVVWFQISLACGHDSIRVATRSSGSLVSKPFVRQLTVAAAALVKLHCGHQTRARRSAVIFISQTKNRG